MQLPHSARRGIPHRLAFVLTSLLLPLFAASCGSGGGQPATSSRITATIAWPARSRAISATSSALSLRISIPKGNLDGSDFVWNIDRDNNPAAHVMAVTSTAAVRFGTYMVAIEGLQLPAAGQAPDLVYPAVANGSATVVLGSGRNALPPISLTSAVAHVVVATTGADIVASPQENLLLRFTATNAQGQVVLMVTPGSAFWRLQSSSGFVQLSQDGMLQWDPDPATATVTVTVDGVTSAPTTLDTPCYSCTG